MAGERENATRSPRRSCAANTKDGSIGAGASSTRVRAGPDLLSPMTVGVHASMPASFSAATTPSVAGPDMRSTHHFPPSVIIAAPPVLRRQAPPFLHRSACAGLAAGL